MTKITPTRTGHVDWPWLALGITALLCLVALGAWLDDDVQAAHDQRAADTYAEGFDAGRRQALAEATCTPHEGGPR